MEKLEDGVEDVGGGERGNEGTLDTAAVDVVPNVVAEQRTCTNQGSSARGYGARAPRGPLNAAAAWWASAQQQGCGGQD